MLAFWRREYDGLMTCIRPQLFLLAALICLANTKRFHYIQKTKYKPDATAAKRQ